MASRTTRINSELLAEDGEPGLQSPIAQDVSAAMQLPTDRPRPASQQYTADGVQLRLSSERTERLKTLSDEHDVPLFVSLLSAWSVLLWRWSGHDELVIGTRFAQAPGPFERSAALRIRLHGNATIRQLLIQAGRAVNAACANLGAPFEQVPTEFQFADSPMRIASSATSLELSLSLNESEHGLAGTLEYASELFDRETIERMIACWQVLLEGMVSGSQQPISRLPMLTPLHRHELLQVFNDTAAAYPRGRLIHELFEGQAQRTPDAVAMTFSKQQLTYAELNSRANQLAWHLKERGIGPDRLVAICFKRSLDIVVALLGVLKAGGAYVPLDPSYPYERLEYMLHNSSPSILLTHGNLKDALPQTSAQVISLDDDSAKIAAHPTGNLPAGKHSVSARNLAYVIYTSGSTGTPKGVMLEHGGLCNLAFMQLQRLAVRPDSRVLQFASLSFDACTWECVMTLCAGARLCIASRDDLAPGEPLLQTLITQKITHVTLPPVALGALPSCDDLPLSTLVVAGEACVPALVQQWAPGRRFINAYGPTEVTVCASMQLCEDRVGGNVPIGRPIENAQIHILDGFRQLVPIGVIGEIYIGGAGVARGYLKRPELTAERFIADPFSADPGARVYKTGDVGRWLRNGVVEFLGRNDDQVKIRGFRIELGEIEARLAQHPEVKEAVVVAADDATGGMRLVAYVTKLEHGNPNVEDLRSHLSALLPNYMVPSAYVILEQFPLTPNGKLDRRALPAPEEDAYVRRTYEEPQGDVEELLAGIWCELLGIERVGRQDNFFELGGQSLLIVRMLEQLRKVGLSAEVSRIFSSATLADLASALMDETIGKLDIPLNMILPGCEAITPQMVPLVALESQHIEAIVQSVPGGAANIQDIYPLTPLQEGILFHHKLDRLGGDTYVIPVLLQLASREKLDEFVQALQQVINRHDTLRTAVLAERLPQPVQVVHRQAWLPVDELILDAGRDSLEQLQEWLKPERQKLDLRQAPLVRLQIAADPHGSHWYALLLHHHVIADHASVEIILEEVKEYLDGDSRALPKPLPYRNHVAQIQARSRTDDAEIFFKRKLADVDEPTAAFGLLNVHGDGRRIDQYNQVLEPRVSKRVRALARQFEVSAATLFHAAWALVVSRTSGRDDVVFGTVLLGRLQMNTDAQRGVGLFVNTLPLRLQLQGTSTGELIEQTQRELVELLNHEQTSLSVAQRCSGTAGKSPLFNTLLNYLHSTVPVETGQPMLASGIQVLAAREWTNYPITISVADQGEAFVLDIATDRTIEPRRIAAYMQTAVRSLVDALEDAPHTPAHALSILPLAEVHQVMRSFNATQAAYRRERLIHGMFEEQVELTPHATAVIHEGQSLSYAELNRRANQIARYLRDRGVGQGQLVGVCVERSLEMIVALLGILKAGAAYVPLDPNYPSERLQYMLEDAAPPVVLTQEKLKIALPATDAELISLDTKRRVFARYSEQNLSVAELGLATQDLVYVIYTSGSTGRPKGTGMAHRQLVNLIEWHRRTFGVSDGQRVLQFAALSFDVAFQETFSTLCTGGTLVLLDEWVRRDARALTEILRDQAIQRLFVPPLMLQNLAEYLETADVIPPTSLRDVITAGEQLRISAEVSALFKRLPDCRLHNHYGPTETHVVTALTVPGSPHEWPTFPTIGRPISNTQIYILDSHGQLVPVGVTGEIFIGGAGVAHGYMGHPETTAQRFVPNPFNTDAETRVYKTGDLGRWTADGAIEYLGRNDDQVKIRGYRIELGEIQAQLVSHAQVKDAAVIVREDAPGDKRLVAYVTRLHRGDASVEELRQYLQAVLPEYMVPRALVTLDALPLTPNGKLDRRALPAPDVDAYASHEYEAPRGEIEEAIAGVWRALIRVDRIGRRDNFFELGGHSLLATRVVSHVNNLLDVDLPLRALFDNPTVAALSACVVQEITAEVSAEAS